MPPAKASHSLWILSPGRDLLWFILPPAFIIPLILTLKQVISPETLGHYVLGLGGFGHHQPGFIRAYADGVHFAKTQRAVSVQVMSKYMRNNDLALVNDLYDLYIVQNIPILFSMIFKGF